MRPCRANIAHRAYHWCHFYMRTCALLCKFPNKWFEIICWYPYRHLLRLISFSIGKGTGVEAWSCTYRGS